MLDSFALRLLTPSGLVREERVTSVNLPSSNGQIGILPHHTRYMGLLGIGILEYTAEGAQSKARLVVSGGFCTFTDDILTVLADGVDTVEDVNRATFNQNREEFLRIIETKSTSDPEWILAQERLSRIEAVEKLLIA